MEPLFLYFVKVSGLIAVFFLSYHFLVRKETFFNSSRWFLLSGLLTSVVLPLFFFKKIIFVTKPKPIIQDVLTISEQSLAVVQNFKPIETIDWFQIGAIGYGIIVTVLVIKIFTNFVSLFQLLNKQQIIKQEKFALVNLKENIAPFSFFYYIVFNSSLYSDEELQSILLHEKIHSQERHSFDILIAKLFCIVFWFNPFVYLYYKAITQNLEYIADQKAIEQLEDKKAYQKALLKVVSHQSCLSITNNFYQSLIKKRIVMLNKNQSHKRNSWKYAVILPLLVAFVICFQVKVIAQEKKEKKSSNAVSAIAIGYSTDKNATNEEMKNDTKTAKEQLGVDYKFSNIKRNDKGEIIAIKIEYKTKEGKSGKIELDSNNPIEPIYFNADGDKVGFSKNDFFNSSNENSKTVSISYKNAIIIVGGNNDPDFPIPPTPPTPPTTSKIAFTTATPPNYLNPPTAPTGTPLTNEKEWKKFEKKMAQFEEKMEAMEPEMEAYTLKMSNIDEQMKPFEKEMEVFEKKMEIFEIQMEEHQKKVEAYQEHKKLKE